MVNVVDLFSGVGGLSLGFRQAGFNIVIANEIDSDISRAYEMNHPEGKMINEDITKLEIESVFSEYKGKIDVVIGGPPCQGFSQKGARRILDDERNFLFKYYLKVVDYLRPKYFLMENVPNLLTANRGSFKQDIYHEFENIGYQLDSAILNAFDYGVPQTRRRAFILGKLNGAISLPLGFFDKVTAWDAISDLAFLNSGEGSEEQDYLSPALTPYQKKLRERSVKLFNHVATKHSNLAIERMQLVPPEKGKESLPKEHLTKSIYSGTWSRIVKSDPSVTITTRFDTPSSGRFTHPYLHRAITVREAARLQSFPDNFIFYGPKTSQMKQVGNAVPPLLANRIAETIKLDIIKNNELIMVNKR
ncbi:DNA cytosine methyltransferase [Bacillus subtilis]|uniref:DNA cytosine methyltransferase n=1 Tax=Bacillus subtilis TaxID=1423 RepID=UPI000667EDCF|nr:DNA cytosine methyltransferase [Bacillus subtilis]PAC84663.1 DNA cytosine methyltransferase [Bacillus subtilis]PAE66838.1 DNA cytosine methyltransferase [Bacillus subtilis]